MLVRNSCEMHPFAPKQSCSSSFASKQSKRDTMHRICFDTCVLMAGMSSIRREHTCSELVRAHPSFDPLRVDDGLSTL